MSFNPSNIYFPKYNGNYINLSFTIIPAVKFIIKIKQFFNWKNCFLTILMNLLLILKFTLTL